MWMELCNKGVITIEYDSLGSIQYFLNQNEIPILDTIYEDKVHIHLISPIPWDELINRLNDICSGKLTYEKLGEVYYPMDR